MYWTCGIHGVAEDGPAYELVGYGAATELSYGPDCVSYGPDCVSYGPDCVSYGPDCVSYGPDCMSYGSDCMSYGSCMWDDERKEDASVVGDCTGGSDWIWKWLSTEAVNAARLRGGRSPEPPGHCRRHCHCWEWCSWW
ncbi:hypothetical protein SHKM778_83250 [Streptomyces sp. KM77-8]|uniref:Granulins domain-containing protein n=1 Tax=Streptomyces haneummycinicus TaxID=3074435 RepID=A0AAT9HX29_9ACTN